MSFRTTFLSLSGHLALVRSVLLSLDAGAGRRTAALVWGMDLLVEPTKVECRVPASRRRVAGADVDARSSINEKVELISVLLATHQLYPSSQFTVHDGARVIGRFDFCFEKARLIIECDGRRWHDPDDVRRKDRHRDNALQRLGWRILRFDWDEVRNSPAYVLAAVCDCLALAGA